MEDDITPEMRAQEEAELRARDEKRRREEEDRRRRVEDERRAEEKRIQMEQQKRLEEERRRQKQEEEWKKLGSDKILALAPIPPSIVDDSECTSLKAWYLDDEVSKPVLRQHSLKPGHKLGAPPVTLAVLKDLGISYYKINLNDFGLVNQIVKERSYKHTDELRVSQTCKDDQYLEKWFVEHMNEDEQVRLITDGSCYYDVRSRHDTWIRLQPSTGDLFVLPAGLYHRGTLDEDDYCAKMRLFRETQRWCAFNRSEKRAETHSARVSYLKMLKKGNVSAELGIK